MPTATQGSLIMSLQKLSIALVLSAGLAATTAHARDGEKPYIGLDYTVFTFDVADDIEFEPHAARVRAGTVLNKFLAVEAHAGAGIKGDTQTFNIPSVGDVEVRSDVESLYAIFLRPQLKVENISLYALVGYGYVKAELSIPHTTIEDDQDTSDISFGAGLELNIGEKWGVNANFVRYVEDAEAFGAGVTYRF